MASNTSGSASGNNTSGVGSSSRQPIYVTPLNSMPYIGEDAHLPTHHATEPAASPTFLLLPAEKSLEELKTILDSDKGTVILCGSAATGAMGPRLGKLNIYETNDSYQFVIAFPGVVTHRDHFSCDIDCDGKVIIRGVVATGEQIVCKHGFVFKMLSQNIGPPGRFSLAFSLPGPVDHLQFAGRFQEGGMVEGIVKKKIPN